jgi:hypothetical protein
MRVSVIEPGFVMSSGATIAAGGGFPAAEM